MLDDSHSYSYRAAGISRELFLKLDESGTVIEKDGHWDNPFDNDLTPGSNFQALVLDRDQEEFDRFLKDLVAIPGTRGKCRLRLMRPDQTLISLMVQGIKSETAPFVMVSLFPLGWRSRSQLLLQTIAEAQEKFIVGSDSRTSFNILLEKLLQLTDSEYGFIGEVREKEDGTRYLKTHAITNIAWNEETRTFYEQKAPAGLEFYNMQTLFGAVISSGNPVIANSPQTDPRSAGIPKGHPDLCAFLGLPFYKGKRILGMVGIANRPGGYDQELIDFLKPFLLTCSNLIDALQEGRMRKLAEREIDQFFNLSLGLLVVADNHGRFMRLNPAWIDLLGFPPEQLVGSKLSQWVHPKDLVATESMLEQLNHGESVRHFRNRIRTIHGDYLILEWSAKPDPDNKRFYASAVDITKLSKATQELRRAKEAAETANRSK